jgi:hypothetical protein
MSFPFLVTIWLWGVGGWVGLAYLHCQLDFSSIYSQHRIKTGVTDAERKDRKIGSCFFENNYAKDAIVCQCTKQSANTRRASLKQSYSGDSELNSDAAHLYDGIAYNEHRHYWSQ